MLSRALTLARRAALPGLIALLTSALALGPRASQAQLISIKTLPIAEGDQFVFFPSANQGMAGPSLALADSLLDPFLNPAKGARMHAPHFFGAPTFYSVSRNAGGGQTLPLGGIVTNGTTFGGLALVVQGIDPSQRQGQVFGPGVFVDDGSSVQQLPPPDQSSAKENDYVFGILGKRFAESGISVGGSVLWSKLRRMDGVDLLYANSQSIRQYGGAFDARLGFLKEWSGNRSLEAVFVHNRVGMTHDVTFVDRFWDPNVRRVASVARLEHNLDRTRTWGMQVAYQRPLRDSAWRIGGVLTSNLLSHPKLPDYQIQEVQSIPWDPGHSAAYNLGIGVGQRRGGTTFGLDAIYEPILTHTWGEAEGPIETTRGITIPAGAKTIENHFRFSNAILRTGIGQDIKLEGIAAPMQIQLGIALHAIHYWFDQFDHVQAASRSQEERWLEWTRTWGMNFRFDRVELRYAGRSTSGTGRPGIARASNRVGVNTPDALSSSFVPAPNGPLTLTDVRVTTHQISVSLPIR